jgi:hypothetical protein
MIDDLRNELSDLAGNLARKDKIQAMLRSLRDEERELVSREYELRAILSKENADVERLAKTSAAALFYSILGKKDKKLEKEQQEAYAAKLKYDALVRQLDDCCSRIELLVAEQESLSGIDKRYVEVLRQLQNDLKSDSRYADKICTFEKAIGENDAQLREIGEAVSAGRSAMSQIENIERSLDSAEGWGTWDLLGGGLVSDLAKHSHMDEAQAGAEHLQVLLSRFKTELADVHITAQTGQVNVDGFLRFADYFFDGLIADWSVLSRIHDSQASVSQVKSQVSSALSRLESLRRTREADKTRLEHELEELVQSAQS